MNSVGGYTANSRMLFGRSFDLRSLLPTDFIASRSFVICMMCTAVFVGVGTVSLNEYEGSDVSFVVAAFFASVLQCYSLVFGCNFLNVIVCAAFLRVVAVSGVPSRALVSNFE